MCRNITTLRGLEPAATYDEITAAALQFVRKVTGVTKVSDATREPVEQATQEITEIVTRLLDALPERRQPPQDGAAAAPCGGPGAHRAAHQGARGARAHARAGDRALALSVPVPLQLACARTPHLLLSLTRTSPSSARTVACPATGSEQQVQYVDSVVDLVGNTPLVRLHRVTDGVTERDRARQARVLQPRRLGQGPHRRAASSTPPSARASSSPGGTIVEPTSRATPAWASRSSPSSAATGASSSCPTRSAKTSATCSRPTAPRSWSRPTAVAPDSPESYYGVSDRLAREIPGAFKPDQYSNPNGPRSPLRDHRPRDLARHRRQGHPLRRRRRHRRHDHRHRPLPARGLGRLGPHHRRRPRGIGLLGRHRPPLPGRGRRRGLLAGAYDPAVPHEIIAVSDAESFAMTRRLAREEGLLVGGSSGMAVVAALQAARIRRSRRRRSWCSCPTAAAATSARSSTTTGCASYGFSNAPAGHTVARRCSRPRPTAPPPLVYVHPNDTVRDAIDRMTETGVSQLLVLSAEPPVVLGEVVGAVHEERAARRSCSRARRSSPTRSATLVGEPLPLIGVNEPVGSRRARRSRRRPRCS